MIQYLYYLPLVYAISLFIVPRIIHFIILVPLRVGYFAYGKIFGDAGRIDMNNAKTPLLVAEDDFTEPII